MFFADLSINSSGYLNEILLVSHLGPDWDCVQGVKMLDTKKRKCAPESIKTKRAREKLLESFKKQDQKITPEALRTTVEKIHKWIADHNDKRTPIKDKPIQLFAGNQLIADTSKKVKELALMLQNTPALPTLQPAAAPELISPALSEES